MPIITLTTDFGMRDPDLGALKGRILQAIPNAQIIDISHNAIPFDLEEAVYIVQNSLKDFPAGTIHLIGYNSESTTDNPPILSQINDQFYISGNDQIISTAFSNQKAIHFALEQTENNRFLNAQINAAKLLAQGNKPHSFATEIETVPSIKLQQPILKKNDENGKIEVISTKVIYNDNYGNAIFNLKKEDFEKWQEGRSFYIKFGIHKIKKIVTDYKNEKELTMDGKMYARFNDFGYFEIFIYKSNIITGAANTLLRLQKNSTVHFVFET